MRTTLGLRAGAILAAVVMLAACGEEAAPGGGPTPDGSPTSVEQPTEESPAPPPPAPSAHRTAAVDAAVADLAEHLGIDPEAVGVVSLEEVTWPDGSLGCPKPGRVYTMAQVPGQRLVLEAEGREYSYHAGRTPPFVRCDTPRFATGGDR